MEAGSAFDRLDDLIDRIADRLGELNAGALDLEKLEELCDDARELNERLIVLRHRARVEKVRGKGGERPIDPRQINLIQAIEHEKHMRRAKREEKRRAAEAAATASHGLVAEPGPAPPTPGPVTSTVGVGTVDAKPPLPGPAGGPREKEPPFRLMPPPPERPARPAIPSPGKITVAEKLEHAPITDLPKAIVLSQKFWFINEIFGKDASTYEKAIKRINTAGGLEEAFAILEGEMQGRMKKGLNEEALTELKELIQRRFKT